MGCIHLWSGGQVVCNGAQITLKIQLYPHSMLLKSTDTLSLCLTVSLSHMQAQTQTHTHTHLCPVQYCTHQCSESSPSGIDLWTGIIGFFRCVPRLSKVTARMNATDTTPSNRSIFLCVCVCQQWDKQKKKEINN